MQDKRIAKFRQAAEKIAKQIEQARRPMTQNLTPKRNKQYRQRLWEADNMERGRKALLALADALERCTCPPELQTIKSPSEVHYLVYKGLKHGRYYDLIPDDAYRDKTPAGLALQALIDPRNQSTPPDPIVLARQIDALEADARLAKLPGYFPTPPPVAQRMADLADIQPFERVLEPSAGSGRLIDAALAAQPDCEVDALEWSEPLRRLLALKQKLTPFELLGSDFLEFAGPPLYDVILMNPPFERASDIRHVLHAFEHHLRPGGRLVAIVSTGALYRSDRLAQSFRALVDEASANPEGIALPSGTFDDTGVAAVIIELTKPALDEPYIALFDAATLNA